MKNTSSFFLLIMISLGFWLQSCEKKNPKTSSPVITSLVKKDISENHQNLIENYDYQNFSAFYHQLQKAINNKSEIINFCDFPFNGTISKEEFSQNEIISEEIKNLILNKYPEKSDEKYIIDNDSFFILFEKNKLGNWKIKSIEASY